MAASTQNSEPNVNGNQKPALNKEAYYKELDYKIFAYISHSTALFQEKLSQKSSFSSQEQTDVYNSKHFE